MERSIVYCGFIEICFADAPGKSDELEELDEEPAELVPLGMKTGNGVFARRRSKPSFFGEYLSFTIPL